MPMAQHPDNPDRPLIRPTKQARSRKQTQRIIGAGLALLQDHNFQDLTVEQIAERAGCSVGTLYKRFVNKEALLEVIAENVSEEILRELTGGLSEQIETTASLDELSRRLVVYFVELMRHQERLVHAMLARRLLASATNQPLQQAANQVIDLALTKAVIHRPAAIPRIEFERRFRIAMQMTLGTLVYMVIGATGPMLLHDEGIEQDLTRSVLDIVTAPVEPEQRRQPTR